MQVAAAVAPVAEADCLGVQHSGVDNKTPGNAERFGLFMVDRGYAALAGDKRSYARSVFANLQCGIFVEAAIRLEHGQCFSIAIHHYRDRGLEQLAAHELQLPAEIFDAAQCLELDVVEFALQCCQQLLRRLATFTHSSVH